MPGRVSRIAKAVVAWLAAGLLFLGAYGALVWRYGWVVMLPLLFGAATAWAVGLARARGRVGVVASLWGGALGGLLAAMLAYAFTAGGMLQEYVFPLCVFWGTAGGLVLALCLIPALLGVERVLARRFGRPPVFWAGRVARLLTTAFGVLFALTIGMTAAEYLAWDVRPHRRPAASWNAPGARVLAGSFAPDGRTLATVGYKGVMLWEVPSGRELARFQQPDDQPRRLAYSPDGARLAVVNSEGKVTLRKANTGEVVGAWRTGGTGPLLFSPDGRSLVTTDDNYEPGAVVRWDVATGRIQATAFGAGNGVTCRSAAFSPDGTLLALALGPRPGGGVEVLDGRTLEPVRRLSGLGGDSRATAFSPDGKTLAVGSAGEVVLWEVGGWRRLGTLAGHGSLIVGLAFSPGGRLLASASWDEWPVWLWDVRTRQRKLLLKGLLEPLPSLEVGLAASPDGNWLAANDDRGIKLWSLDSLEQLAKAGRIWPPPRRRQRRWYALPLSEAECGRARAFSWRE